MPCEVVCGFYFLQHICHTDGCNIKGATVWILKTLVLTPWLKTCKSCYCTAQIFVV